MQKSYQLSLITELDGGGCSQKAMRMAGLLPSVKSAMQRALAAAVPSLSRDQLVDRMNGIARQYGIRITSGRSRVLSLALLEKWLNPNDSDYEPSIRAFQVFMLALGGIEPLRVLAEFNGCKLITDEQISFYEYGKAKFEAREKARQLKQLEERLAEQRKQRRTV